MLKIAKNKHQHAPQSFNMTGNKERKYGLE